MVILILVFSISLISSVYAEIQVGDIALDFDLEDLDGNEYNLSEYNGKIIMLLFWTTDQDNYDEMLSSIQKQIYNIYNEEGLEIWSINHIDTEEEINDIITNNELIFSFFIDDSIAKLYEIDETPSMIIINTDGIISYSTEGIYNLDEITSNLNNLLHTDVNSSTWGRIKLLGHEEAEEEK